MEQTNCTSAVRQPWNKGKLVGQKTPLKLREIWAIRIRLQLADRRRELALFNLAIDSKLRGCDLVKLRVRDVCHGQAIASRLGRECRRARRRELGEQRFQCAHQQCLIRALLFQARGPLDQ